MTIEEGIKQLVSYHSGVESERLREDTLIEEDLGTTGDDAWELLENLQKKYDADFSSFDFLMHFGPEAGCSSHQEYGYYPVSLGHLIAVVEKGSWFLPSRSEENYARNRANAVRSKLLYLGVFIGVVVIFLVFRPAGA